jgi:ribosomal protein L40E
MCVMTPAPRAQDLVCWKCGASLAALTLPLPLRRLEACPACNAELHVCRMCADYDPAVANSCREPIAEEVREKDRANFCDYFQPRPDAFTPPDKAAIDSTKTALDALFSARGDADAANGGSAEAARTQLDALFRPDR